MRKDLPSEVFRALQDRLRSGCTRGEGGWESGKEEEDTLTGDFCGSLRTNWEDVGSDDGRRWRFKITYRKFRGRGKGAEERVFGTDGIVEVQLEDVDADIKTGKGLLFQAKKRGAKGKKKLMEQANNMERIAPTGSAIFEYGPDKYIGVDASKLIDNPTVLSADSESLSRLGDYLADRFLPCHVGKKGMFYDAVSRSIIYPDGQGNVVRARATLRHRLRIEIRAE